MRTISKLSQKYRIHASQINLWKKQLPDGAESIFEDVSGKSKPDTDEPQAAELYEQIGRLNVQLEWLKKSGRGR